jgi:hypothetical protein
MAKHPHPKHLLISLIAFTMGYVISGLIEGTFGWHAYVAGVIAHLITYYALRYFAP